MTTSASMFRSSGGQGAPASWASASTSHQLRPGYGGTSAGIGLLLARRAWYRARPHSTSCGGAPMTHERPRSWEVTEGPERAPARAMLRAVGVSDEDMGKPQIAVASSWNEVTPCNYHLDKLAALAKEGVRQGGAVPVEFTTIAVSDAIAMGHEGMRASLISREVIADSVELMMHAERFDALVGIAGCDKSEPGMLMAMARLDLPAIYLYGGTILPGTHRGKDVTIH